MTKMPPVETEQLAALVASLVDAKMRERERAEAPVGKALREEAVDYLRTVIDSPERGDAKAVRVHLPVILDLPFHFEGAEIRLGDIPTRRLTLLMGKAWHRELKRKTGAEIRLAIEQYSQRHPEAPRWANRNPDGSVRIPGRAATKISKPSYRNRHINTLESLVTYVMGDEKNPLHGWERESVKGYKREGCFVGEAQLEQYLAFLPPWLRPMVRLAVEPGCLRLSEILYLEKTEVHLAARKIVFAPGLRTKNRKGRDFPIMQDENLAILEALIKSSPSPRYVFCKPTGEPYSQRWVQKLMKEASERSGIRLGPKQEKPTAHYLRRTGVTWGLVRFGGNTKLMAKYGGWDDIKTMNDYVDLTPQVLGQAEESTRNVKIDDLVKERRDASDGPRRDPQAAMPPHRRRSRRAG